MHEGRLPGQWGLAARLGQATNQRVPVGVALSSPVLLHHPSSAPPPLLVPKARNSGRRRSGCWPHATALLWGRLLPPAHRGPSQEGSGHRS